MHDPHEGLTPEGLIRTGVRRDRIPPAYEPILAAITQEMKPSGDISLYLYGSVATGTASPPHSDVDLLTIGILPEATSRLANTLSARFPHLCRSIEIAPALPRDFVGDSDPAYGGRVFLRHYCLHLHGPDLTPEHPFPGDTKAARGFNGDIEHDYQLWRTQSANQPSEQLARRIARKTLVTIAGLVSIHDHTWTTDRTSSALR